MSHYRGYFIKDDHIVAHAVIDATDDAQAMLKASELLFVRQFLSVEVWQETRVVGALSASGQSHESVGALEKDDSHFEGGASNIAEFRTR
jgi:hypothetical protein